MKTLFDLTIKLLPIAELTRAYVNAVYMEKIDIERREAKRLLAERTKVSDIRKIKKMEQTIINRHQSELNHFDAMFNKLVEQYKDTAETVQLIEFTADMFNIFWLKAVKVNGYDVSIDTDEPVYLKTVEAYAEAYKMTAEDVNKEIDSGELKTCLVEGKVVVIC